MRARGGERRCRGERAVERSEEKRKAQRGEKTKSSAARKEKRDENDETRGAGQMCDAGADADATAESRKRGVEKTKDEWRDETNKERSELV